MAYYVGRDVDVYWGTEQDTHGIKEHSDFTLQIDALGGSAFEAGTIVGSLVDVGEPETLMKDVTGVDLSIGAQDEDISFFGVRNVGKIEVKKDTSITITMKKKDRKFLQLYQGACAGSGHAEDGVGGHSARWGLVEGPGNSSSGNPRIQGGDFDPKSCVQADATTLCSYGYRVILNFKDESSATAGGGACVVLRNCTLSEVTHTTSNEAADEESVTFTTQVKPLIGNAKRTGANARFHADLTTQTLLTDV